MSLSAALILAAAATASSPPAAASRGVVLGQARVTAQILPAVRVRQADGPVAAGEGAPVPRLTRRGRTVLVEFE